jgi:hypothetical protein
VTGSTITLTYRYAVTPEEQQLSALVGPSLLPTNQEVTSVMNAYISVFNKDFELYGRHVVLKAFQGKGDFLAEDQGSGQAQAQEDADTAKALGSFANISLLGSTPPFIAALAGDHIISIGGLIQSTTVMAQLAPYDYETNPDCQKVAAAGVQIIGRAMSGLPAEYAGSPATARKSRVFALLSPDNQSYDQCSGIVATRLKKEYGIDLAVDLHYPLNLTGGAALAENTVAQLKSAGVTTVVCACDPVTPIYLTGDANAIDYHPEWFAINLGDAYNRLPNQQQWSHAMAGGAVPVPRSQDEAYKVFRMVDPTGPLIATYAQAYEPLLLFFDALQAAGPDLTPVNFRRGMDSLPPSLPGAEFGPWRFGPSTYDPAAGFEMMWWDPTGVSPQDGLKGVFRPCNGGAIYGYDGVPSLPLHQQPRCFTKAPVAGAAVGNPTTSTSAARSP